MVKLYFLMSVSEGMMSVTLQPRASQTLCSCFMVMDCLPVSIRVIVTGLQLRTRVASSDCEIFNGRRRSLISVPIH